MLKDFLENGKYFIKDGVVTNSSQDKFNHKDICKNLKNIIDSNDAPFSIAITGEWGLGKSSIIELLKDTCKSNKNSSNYKFCDISAWKYEKEAIRKSFLKNIFLELDGKKPSKWDELIDAIRNTTQNEDSKKLTFKEKMVSFFKSSCKIFIQTMVYALGILLLVHLFWKQIEQFNIKDNFWVRILFPIVSGIVISIIQLFSNVFKNKTFVRVVPPIESTDEYEELFNKRRKELIDENPNLKIIVVVDDLDRLCPQKMVEALDAIKAFEGCIFIVPFDEQILKNALEDKKVNLSNNEHLTITGELFLEKMFQFKIPLNPMIETDIRSHAIDIITKQTIDLYSLIGEEDLSDVLDILIHTGVSNPRKLKKIINVFANNLLLVKRRELGERLNKGLLSDKEGIRLVAKLSVLQADFSDFYKILSNRYDYIDKFLEIVKQIENFNNEKDDKLEFNSEKLKFSESAQFFIFKYGDKNELINIELKKEYLHLYHFLNATNDVPLDKINSFIFMGQSLDAYTVGDKTTREIINAVTSNSVVPIKNAFISNQANIITIENLIISSLTTNMVKYRIRNTIYCLVNALTEYNSVSYFNEVGNQLRKLLAVKQLNSIRFELDCVFMGFKRSSSDGYSFLIEDIIKHLINNDIKYTSPDGKQMDKDETKLYILKLYSYLINLNEEITGPIRKQCQDLSGEILQGENVYVLPKEFLDEFILDNGGSNCIFIDKGILLKALVTTIINEENNSKTYFTMFKQLLEHFFEKDKEQISESLYNLINGGVSDEEILDEVLKYATCITEQHSNYIIECLHFNETYKDRNYSNILMKLIEALHWSEHATKFIDVMLVYMHKQFATNISEGLLSAIDNNCINDMTSFTSEFFSNIFTFKQYFNISDRLFVAFNNSSRIKFLNILCPYIQSVQNISKEDSIAVRQACQALVKVDESRRKIIDALTPTLISWSQHHSDAAYSEWVAMNVHIFEVCCRYVSKELMEKFIDCANSFVSLSTEVVDSIIRSFNIISSDVNGTSRIKMVNFIILKVDYITNIGNSLAIVKSVISDNELKEKFNTKTGEFITFIEKVADKNLFETTKLLTDYNVSIPVSTIRLLIDKFLLDSNYNDDNEKLLALLFRRECANSETGLNVIEDILKRENSDRLDRFVLQVFSQPDMQQYELFKDVLYSENARNTLQAYNILNLAKAFEGLFSKTVKGDLISKMLSYTDNSYNVVLERIEQMYKNILEDKELKQVIANELALLIKRVGNDEEGEKDLDSIISFTETNGLIPALKKALKEYGIKFDENKKFKEKLG